MASISSSTKPQETRALGWYAVRWLNVTDWFKVYKSRQKKLKKAEPLAMPKLNSTSQPAVKEGGSSGQAAGLKYEDKAEENESTSGQKAESKLADVVKESKNILVRARAMAPFQLFPDVITIDRHKLTIVYRRFFNVGQTVSVPIENIKNIQADIGPFSGSLTITSDHFINNTQEIKNLRRSDVINIQKLVQGAMVAVKENIDVTDIETDKLIELLSQLGEGHT